MDALLRANNAEAVAGLTFPVYGLDDRWSGRRSIGGWGGQPIDRFTLAHGEPFVADAPLLRVATIRPEPRQASGVRETNLWMEARSLVLVLAEKRGEPTSAIRATLTGPDPYQLWEDVSVDVDGSVVTARVLRHDDEWIAVLSLTNADLALFSRRVAITDVRLVVVDDLGPTSPGVSGSDVGSCPSAGGCAESRGRLGLDGHLIQRQVVQRHGARDAKPCSPRP